MTIGATMNPIIIGIIVKNDHQGLPAVFPQSTHIARGRMLLSSTVIPCSPQWGQRHIFIYCFQAERQRSPDAAPCAAYGATPCSLRSLFGVQLTEKFIKPFFCERFTLEPLWTEFVSFLDIVLRLEGVYRFCQFGQSGVGK